jgi:HTH domain
MPTRKGTAHHRRDAAKGEGGKPMPRKVDAKTVRRLKPLVEQGLSEREIQKKLGISRTTLQPYIKRLKTELSPNYGESHAVPANADPAQKCGGTDSDRPPRMPRPSFHRYPHLFRG